MSSTPYKPGKCKRSGISEESAVVKRRSWLNPKEIKMKKKKPKTTDASDYSNIVL